MLDLYVVIVNYNTRELLRQCLASVYDSRGTLTYGVCVVDNCSTDESAAMVRKQYPHADRSQATSTWATPAPTI